jgi:hypothetical protein
VPTQRRRARQQQDGITYLEAHRLIDASGPAAIAEGRATVGFNPPDSSTRFDPPDPHTMDGMLYLATEDWSTRRNGDPVDDDVWSGFESVADLGLQEPTVGELVLRPWTIDSQVVDEYEGGTVAATRLHRGRAACRGAHVQVRGARFIGLRR